MNRKRVFKTRSFDRWARKVLPDPLLCRAAQEIEQGQYEADLGHGVCKKRVARPGQGKRGSTRTLVAKQHVDAIIFLVGREKSAPGPDFPDPVVEAAKAIAADLHVQPMQKLGELTDAGLLKEICHAEQER